jgi:hypothetical protein
MHQLSHVEQKYLAVVNDSDANLIGAALKPNNDNHLKHKSIIHDTKYRKENSRHFQRLNKP